MERVARLREITTFFLRLGATAFGGPAAHLVRMQQEFVERNNWLSREEFLELVGACNLMPGPGSTQVAMALGYRRAGWPGLILAGICFVLPASLATLFLAWLYRRYGSLPLAQSILYGARPVMVAILADATFKLGKTAFRGAMPLRTALLILIAILSLTAAAFAFPPLLILLPSGAILLLATFFQSRSTAHTNSKSCALWLTALPITAPSTASLISITLVFLKLGIVVFGSGYVLIAFLRTDLVDRLHWITNAQLYDAITAGQLTPGPLFATATFIGYLIHGNSGAFLATMAIFLPSFFMAGMVGTLAPKIRASKLASSFLAGVTAAAVALMLFVAWQLTQSAIIDKWTSAVAIVSFLLLLRFRLNSSWLILAAALLGLALRH